MGFKASIKNDVRNAFLDLSLFAELRNIQYDGTTYEHVPVVLTGGGKERGRSTRMADHSQGIYLVTDILHLNPDDIGGIQPEHGTVLAITDDENSTYYIRYYVIRSQLKGGMLRVELEAKTE